MSVTKTTFAGQLKPAEINGIIVEPIVNDSVAAQVSTVITGATGSKLRIPLVVDENTSDNLFTAELAEIEIINPSVSQLELEYRKLAALSVVSSEVLEDSELQVLEMAGRSLTREVVRKVDTAAFGNAAPANGFPGIQAWHGQMITSVTADGPNGDFVVDAGAEIRKAGGTPNVILTTPDVLRVLQKAKVATGSNMPLYGTSAAAPVGETIHGIPVVTSPHVKADQLYVIDRDALVFAIHRDVKIDRDDSAGFTRDGTLLRLTTRIAFGAVQPGKIALVDFTGIGVGS